MPADRDALNTLAPGLADFPPAVQRFVVLALSDYADACHTAAVNRAAESFRRGLAVGYEHGWREGYQQRHDELRAEEHDIAALRRVMQRQPTWQQLELLRWGPPQWHGKLPDGVEIPAGLTALQRRLWLVRQWDRGPESECLRRAREQQGGTAA